jgi:hypothetical protein
VSLCGAQGERSKRRDEFFIFVRVPRYIHRLTDEYTTTYIRQLTDEFTGLCSSIEDIFLGSDTEEYSIVIFLGTDEDKKIEKCTPFSCSGGASHHFSTKETGSY